MAANTIQIRFKTDSRTKDAPTLSINITLDELISTTKKREAEKLENLFDPSKKLNPDQSIEFMAFGRKLENDKTWRYYKKDVLDLLKTTDSSIILYARTNMKINESKKDTNQDRNDITSKLDRLLDPTGKTEEEIAEIERLKRNLAAMEGNPNFGLTPQYNFFTLGVASEPPKPRSGINFENLNPGKSDEQPPQSSNANSFHSHLHLKKSIEAKPLPLEDEACDVIWENPAEPTRKDERRDSCNIM